MAIAGVFPLRRSHATVAHVDDAAEVTPTTAVVTVADDDDDNERELYRPLRPYGNKWTPRVEVFCQLYVLYGNASRAAREAGYKASAAGTVSNNLLKRQDVRDYINDLMEERLADIGLRKDRILEEVLNVALGDIRDIASWDDQGHVKFKPSKDIPDGAARNISSIKVKRTFDALGQEVEEITLTTNPKLPALVALMKAIGITPKDGIAVNVNIDNRKIELSEVDQILADAHGGDE